MEMVKQNQLSAEEMLGTPNLGTFDILDLDLVHNGLIACTPMATFNDMRPMFEELKKLENRVRHYVNYEPTEKEVSDLYRNYPSLEFLKRPPGRGNHLSELSRRMAVWKNARSSLNLPGLYSEIEATRAFCEFCDDYRSEASYRFLQQQPTAIFDDDPSLDHLALEELWALTQRLKFRSLTPRQEGDRQKLEVHVANALRDILIGIEEETLAAQFCNSGQSPWNRDFDNDRETAEKIVDERIAKGECHQILGVLGKSRQIILGTDSREIAHGDCLQTPDPSNGSRDLHTRFSYPGSLGSESGCLIHNPEQSEDIRSNTTNAGMFWNESFSTGGSSSNNTTNAEMFWNESFSTGGSSSNNSGLFGTGGIGLNNPGPFSGEESSSNSSGLFRDNSLNPSALFGANPSSRRGSGSDDFEGFNTGGSGSNESGFFITNPFSTGESRSNNSGLFGTGESNLNNSGLFVPGGSNSNNPGLFGPGGSGLNNPGLFGTNPFSTGESSSNSSGLFRDNSLNPSALFGTNPFPRRGSGSNDFGGFITEESSSNNPGLFGPEGRSSNSSGLFRDNSLSPSALLVTNPFSRELSSLNNSIMFLNGGSSNTSEFFVRNPFSGESSGSNNIQGFVTEDSSSNNSGFFITNPFNTEWSGSNNIQGFITEDISSSNTEMFGTAPFSSGFARPISANFTFQNPVPRMRDDN